MKKLLFCLLISALSFAQSKTAFKNLDAAGLEKAVLQINPEAPKEVLPFRNTKTFEFANGLQILSKVTSEKVWNIVSVSGPFEVVFPLWKKFADEHANEAEILRTDHGTTADRFTRLYKQDDVWIFEF